MTDGLGKVPDIVVAGKKFWFLCLEISVGCMQFQLNLRVLDCFVKAEPIYTLCAWVERCGVVGFVIVVLEMYNFVVA